MKNFSLALNVILLIAVIVLYILHFSSKGTSDTKIASIDSFDVANLSIAYINSDSLLNKYEFFLEKKDELETKGKSAQDKLQGRASGLQQEIAEFQRTAANMTINQARAIEENLQKKQQNLMAYEQSLSQELMQEEAKINEELYSRVSEFLKEYGRDKNLQLVLTYQKGSGVLYANDSMNITSDVIVGLNEKYKSEKAPASENKPKVETDTTKKK